MRPSLCQSAGAWAGARGRDQRAGCHTTFAVPGAGPVSCRLPADRLRVSVWLLWRQSSVVPWLVCNSQRPGSDGSCNASVVWSSCNCQCSGSRCAARARVCSSKRCPPRSTRPRALSASALSGPLRSACQSCRRQLGAAVSVLFRSRRGTRKASVNCRSRPSASQPPAHRPASVSSPAVGRFRMLVGIAGQRASHRAARAASVNRRLSSPPPALLLSVPASAALPPGWVNWTWPRAACDCVSNWPWPVSRASSV